MESIDYFQRMIMYQSIPSLTITPGDPRGFARSHCLRVRDFELEKFSIVFKDKCRNFSICFQETGGSLKSGCSCAVSCQRFAKPVDVYRIVDNIDHFGHLDHFDKIFRLSKSHFANVRSSFKILRVLHRKVYP